MQQNRFVDMFAYNIIFSIPTLLQVFTRLHRLQLCTTYSTLLNLLDYASLGCDEKVNDWQDAQCQLLIKSKFKKTSFTSSLSLS